MDTKIMLIAIAAYAAVNIIVMGMYFLDKHKAMNNEWRIPERTLIMAALFGPVGGTLGMLLAHHKTRKPKFKLVYLFLVIHIVVIAVLLIKL